MSTIANAKVEHNYNRYNGYFFGCLRLLVNEKTLMNQQKRLQVRKLAAFMF